MEETATDIFIDPLKDKPDSLFWPPQVEVEGEPGWLKHVNCEGARFHVLWWNGRGRHCSEPRCIINKPEPTPDIVGRQSHEL